MVVQLAGTLNGVKVQVVFTGRPEQERFTPSITEGGNVGRKGNNGGGNAVLHQLPRSQAGALQERPRLVGIDVNLLALLNGRANYAQRSAVSGCGQGARVAVGEDSALARHERGSVASHGLVGGDVFGVHALGLFD